MKEAGYENDIDLFRRNDIDLFRRTDFVGFAYNVSSGGKGVNKKSEGSDLKKDTRWITSDEIKFLDGLGSWRGGAIYRGSLLEVKKLDHVKRLRFLAAYKTLMKLRKNWESIDRQKISSYLVDIGSSRFSLTF